MVGHFKERIAGTFEHIEPWFIASVAFNPKKHQVDIHIGVRKATDIVCPYCRRVTPYHIYEPHRTLIASVENAHSKNVISRFDYTNDAIGRRTAITRTGSAFSSLSGSITFYDANGNISEYVSSSGSISAHYQYSPFGIPLLSQGAPFTHQFSTKPYCEILDEIKYQMRGYCPATGRWKNRDEEESILDISLYTFINNHHLNWIDYLGRSSIYKYSDNGWEYRFDLWNGTILNYCQVPA